MILHMLSFLIKISALRIAECADFQKCGTQFFFVLIWWKPKILRVLSIWGPLLGFWEVILTFFWGFFAKSIQIKGICFENENYSFFTVNPILHGLLEIHYYMGGSKRSPPIKIHQNDSNLVKRHFLAKIDYCCPLFTHFKFNYYHFWPQKGSKIDAFLHV